MGCISGNTSRQAQPTYQAILAEIFELVVREEQLHRFNKKSEIYKYYNEFDWNAIYPQFKLHLKTLIDHIESYKIRLNDAALYVENKIKLSQNPVIIKMSMLILLELVANLQKFIQTKEVGGGNNDESKQDLVSQRSIIPVQLVSDNFLKFELAFSNILSQLIKSKMLYNLVWWEYLLQSLELFSKKTTKQFQSENIQSILSFLEYILSARIGDATSQFEWMFASTEEQQAMSELIESIKDITPVMVVYKDTVQMISADRLFITKQQRLLFNCLIKGCQHQKVQVWQKLTELFISRLLLQQQYEELFNLVYQQYDEEIMADFDSLESMTTIILAVARSNNLITNLEIYLISKFLEYLESSQISVINHSPNLQKKISETVRGYPSTCATKNNVLKLLIQMFSNIASGQYIIFQQSTIVKAILNNLKQNNSDDDIFVSSELCLIKLLQIIAPDKNAYHQLILQTMLFTYQYFCSLQNGSVINQSLLQQLLKMVNQFLLKSSLFERTVLLTDEILYIILEISDNSPVHYLACSELIVNMLQQNSQEDQETVSGISPNQDLLLVAAHFIAQKVLTNEQLMGFFFEVVVPKLSTNSVYSFVLYFIDDQFRLKKSGRKVDFDSYSDKSSRLTVIIRLVSVFSENKEFNKLLYDLLGAQFQLNKRKCTAQEIAAILTNRKVNDIIAEIVSICSSQQVVDFEKITIQFKEAIKNLSAQNGIINLEEIQMKEEEQRGSMYQSFQAPSHIDIQLDESFEKQLQTIKKQKLKQEKLEHLTTEQKEMVEF